MKQFLNELGLNIALLIGGGIGAFIGRKKDKPMWQQILSVFTAAFIANYTAPVLIEFMSLSEKSLPGLGFIIGYANKGFLDYALDKVKKKIDKKVDPNNHY